VKNNIIKDFKETGCEDVDWIYQAQNSYMWPVLVKAKFNIWVLLNVGNF
jgi:hypothetical protein